MHCRGYNYMPFDQYHDNTMEKEGEHFTILKTCCTDMNYFTVILEQ